MRERMPADEHLLEALEVDACAQRLARGKPGSLGIHAARRREHVVARIEFKDRCRCRDLHPDLGGAWQNRTLTWLGIHVGVDIAHADGPR
jgi:hypothetical protein